MALTLMASNNNLLHISSIADWNFYYNWIGEKIAGISCHGKYHPMGTCKSLNCYRHGQKNRIDEKNRILSMGVPLFDSLNLTINFGIYLLPKKYSIFLKRFFYEIKKFNQNFQYLWRLHFVDFKPNLHISILVIGRNEKSDYRNALDTALDEINHPEKSKVHLGFERTENWENTVSYMYETKRKSTSENSPPVCKPQRWIARGQSRGLFGFFIPSK